MSGLTAELLERVRLLEDRAAIGELFQEYKRVLDGKDFEAYANLFTADGEFVAGEVVGHGREGIHSLVEGMLGNLLAEGEGQDMHLVVNASIEDPRDQQSSAAVTWLYFVPGADGQPELAKVGHYDDDVVRQDDGRWRFRRRSAPSDIPAT